MDMSQPVSTLVSATMRPSKRHIKPPSVHLQCLSDVRKDNMLGQEVPKHVESVKIASRADVQMIGASVLSDLHS